MLGRLGFAGRLLAIILLVLLAALAIGAGAAFVARPEQSRLTPRLPLPEQAAAIVALLEETSVSSRPAVLKAVNTDVLAVTIADVRPQFGDQNRRLPAVEWTVAHYLEAAQGREVIAALEDDPGVSRLRSALEALTPFSRRPLRLAIALRSGGYAVFETRGVGSRLLGLPAGFWIGAIGALVGAAAIRAVMREARPLRLLSDSVNKFARIAEPQHVTPEGAPEIQTLISAVNEMQTRIAKLVEGRTILLGAVSHDLRTFLTRLRLRIEGISDPEQHAKAARDLDDMVHLIDDALAVARGTAGMERKEAVNLAELVEIDVADRPKETCTFNRLVRDASRTTILGDPIGLRRLVANLIDNALRFGTRCAVSVDADNNAVRLIVDDDGPGIPASDHHIVLEPFYRADTSRSRATGGSGLGLAIAKQIANAHNGTIMIERAPLGGARLVVAFKAG